MRLWRWCQLDDFLCWTGSPCSNGVLSLGDGRMTHICRSVRDTWKRGSKQSYLPLGSHLRETTTTHCENREYIREDENASSEYSSFRTQYKNRKSTVFYIVILTRSELGKVSSSRSRSYSSKAEYLPCHSKRTSRLLVQNFNYKKSKT